MQPQNLLIFLPMASQSCNQSFYKYFFSVTCPFWLFLLLSLFICHQVVHLVFRWTRELNSHLRTMARNVSPWRSPLDKGASLCTPSLVSNKACLLAVELQLKFTIQMWHEKRNFSRIFKLCHSHDKCVHLRLSSFIRIISIQIQKHPYIHS
jgi:hypothetical protein